MIEAVECMQPSVVVGVAAYEPDLSFFAAQLQSLAHQTFTEFLVVISDDASEAPIDETFVEKHLQSVPFVLHRQNENIGLTNNFSFLAMAASAMGARYFLPCDQDDVWLKDKIETLVRVMTANPEPALAFSQMAVIDPTGRPTGALVYKSPGDIAKGLTRGDFMRSCPIYGCSMILDLECIENWLAVPEATAHDHWWPVVASSQRRVAFTEYTLVHYRRHATNNSGFLLGTFDHATYFTQRVEVFANRIDAWLHEPHPLPPDVADQLPELAEWATARLRWWQRPRFRTAVDLARTGRIAPAVTAWELLLRLLPPPMASRAIRLIKSAYALGSRVGNLRIVLDQGL